MGGAVRPGVVWWVVVVFCWWMLFVTSQVSVALFHDSVRSDDAAGTGMSTAVSAAGGTGAVVGGVGLGHCFGR